MTDRPLELAVVGSGVSGLTAAHLLAKRHHVTLLERDDRLGGHAHTHDVPTADGRALRLDTGFLVHNERTYPNLLRLTAAKHELFDEIVLRGALSPRGMAGFADLLSEADAHALHAYLIDRAHTVRGKQ